MSQLATLGHCISHGRYHLLLDYTGIIPTPDCHSKLYTDIHKIANSSTANVLHSSIVVRTYINYCTHGKLKTKGVQCSHKYTADLHCSHIRVMKLIQSSWNVPFDVFQEGRAHQDHREEANTKPAGYRRGVGV